MIIKFHQFHIVTLRPWPVITSTVLWASVSNSTSIIRGKQTISKTRGILLILAIRSRMWWKDTIKERKKEGEHQQKVSKGLKIGIVIFITSEIIFFLRFFWSYFHRGVSPTLEIGQRWPPTGINRFDPTNVPLLNTLVLISSGVRVTWAHHCLLNNNMKKRIVRILLTCTLGAYFSALQYIEYKQGEFSIRDSSYGTIFFVATGFHGIHVLIGTTFLVVTIINITRIRVSNEHHNSFEIAAWYWHFVDVVWLFLYLSIYWWGK